MDEKKELKLFTFQEINLLFMFSFFASVIFDLINGYSLQGFISTILVLLIFLFFR